MAGSLIELLRITSYDMSQLASAQSSVVLVEPYINVVQAREASVILRVHSAPTWGAGASIRAELFATDQCRDDPAQLFSTGTAQASAVIAQADNITVPFLKVATVTSGLLATSGLSLKFIQATAASTFKLTVSVDLALKW